MPYPGTLSTPIEEDHIIHKDSSEFEKEATSVEPTNCCPITSKRKEQPEADKTEAKSTSLYRPEPPSSRPHQRFYPPSYEILHKHF